MSFNTWTPLAVSSEAHDWRGSVWRIVETQHTASTMKIVDSQAEQDLLERTDRAHVDACAPRQQPVVGLRTPVPPPRETPCPSFV